MTTRQRSQDDGPQQMSWAMDFTMVTDKDTSNQENSDSSRVRKYILL